MDPPAIPSAEGEDRCDRGFPSRKSSDEPVLLPLASLAAMRLIAQVLRDPLAHTFSAASIRLVSSARDTISAEDIERLTSLAPH
jgi:histone H3/H4